MGSAREDGSKARARSSQRQSGKGNKEEAQAKPACHATHAPAINSKHRKISISHSVTGKKVK